MCLDNGLPPGAMRFLGISPEEVFLVARLLGHRGSDRSSGRHSLKLWGIWCCSVKTGRFEMEGKGFWPGTVAQGPIALCKNQWEMNRMRVVRGWVGIERQ